jgi:hypothetical protein
MRAIAMENKSEAEEKAFRPSTKARWIMKFIISQKIKAALRGREE